MRNPRFWAICLAIFVSLFVLIQTASGLSVFSTVQGGTGTSSPSGILYGSGSANPLKTVTIGSNLTFSAGQLSATDTSFSTTSASYFTSLGLAFSTTSNAYFASVGLAHSTTSANYWSSVGLGFSTTSASYFLSQNQGPAFSTTSASYFAARGLAHSTTSVAYQLTQPVTLGNATATAFFATQNNSTNASTSALTVSGVRSALGLFSATGVLSGYGGASACSANNFVTTISAVGGTTCGTASISGVNLGGTLGALTAGNSSLTFSGSYDGSTPRTVTINLANSNTFTAQQIFTTSSSSAATSSISQYFPFLATAAGSVLAVDPAGKLIATTTGTTAVGANPSGTIGLSAVNGVATTFIRSDGAPALSQSITPTWTGLHIFNTGGIISNASSTFLGGYFPSLNRFGLASTSCSALWGGCIGTSTVMYGGFAIPIASSTANTANVIPDWSSRNTVTVMLQQTSTVDLSGTSTHATDGQYVTLQMCQDGTGNRTQTYIGVNTPVWALPEGTTTIRAAAYNMTRLGIQYQKRAGTLYPVVIATSSISDTRLCR